MNWRWWLLCAIVSAKQIVALTAAFSSPGCLVGYSEHGLPWIAPTIASLVLLGRGWILWSSDVMKWRLLSAAYLLGSSMFATTPLWRAWDARLPAWEIYPLCAVSLLMLIEAWVALKSRHGRYRALAICSAAAVALAVAFPYVPPLVERWPQLVIFGVYGSLGAVLATDLYAHRHQEKP